MGGLSSFSSFVYGAFEVMTSPGLLLVGLGCLLISIIGGDRGYVSGKLCKAWH